MVEIPYMTNTQSAIDRILNGYRCRTMDVRPSWDEYFMQQCDLVASRSTCDRKHVGSVIVKDKRVIATGYNGSVPGEDHCDDAGHQIVNGHCIRTIHSELNALLQAARFGTAVDGATLYCNTKPCLGCMKAIVAAGIREIVYRDEYGEGTIEASESLRIRRYGE